MKIKTHYVCQECGTTSPKWLGRCTGCGNWNSMVEERLGGESASSSIRPKTQKLAPKFERLEERTEAQVAHARSSTGLQELDRVLGGGMVPDSFILIGGDPGIGKSTILLQVARGLKDKKVLYVSGEESAEQIRSRAERLGVQGEGRIFLAAETELGSALALVDELEPQVLIMDSLQTFVSSDLESAPGSVSQVREIAAKLMQLAKSRRICVWLVGHVTKEGSIAGPKVVEHMVDTVLYFEGDSSQTFRLLRTVKNRFGSSRELGVFEMGSEGLEEVLNPSSLFLSDRKDSVAGTAITASMEGTRPILVELQALVAPSVLAMPRRTTVGMDTARVSLIGAILERHLRLPLAQHDLFLNVVGGLRLSEPAADLAAAAALWSSLDGRAWPQGWIFFGELGLTGEVRRIPLVDVRVEEAKKLGFTTCVIPASAYERCKKISGIELRTLDRLAELPRLMEMRKPLSSKAGNASFSAPPTSL
jgi:DNA repair protein RadA/Sms